MKRASALLLLTAACHDPESAAPPARSSATASAVEASAASSQPLPSRPSATPVATDDLDMGGWGLAGIGEAGGKEDPRPRLIPALKFRELNVKGRLPPEVVQRVVRQASIRLRTCYVSALAHDGSMETTLTTTFVIDAHGSTKQVASKSPMPDKAFVPCANKVFAALSFPVPEAGTVAAGVTIAFTPPKASFTIGGKPSISVTEADVVKAVQAAGYAVSADRPSQPNAQVSPLVVNKSDVKLYLTLDREHRLPLADYERMKRDGVVLEDGGWFLGVTGDKVAAQALVDAIHVKLPK